MSRYKFNNHTFDMNEYFSGERFVVGGLNCDWEIDEEEELKKNEIEKSLTVEVPKKSAKRLARKQPLLPEVK